MITATAYEEVTRDMLAVDVLAMVRREPANIRHSRMNGGTRRQSTSTVRASLADVAREVGKQARRYANQIIADSNLGVVVLGGPNLDSIGEGPARIVWARSREARHAMSLKRLEAGN